MKCKYCKGKIKKYGKTCLYICDNCGGIFIDYEVEKNLQRWI